MKNNIIKNVYFVNIGERTGQFLNIIDYDKKTNKYFILAFPESEALYVTENELETAILSEYVSFVETLPDDICEECKKEFFYRINNK